MTAEEYDKLKAPASQADYSAIIADKDTKYGSVEKASRRLILFGALLAALTVVFAIINYFGSSQPASINSSAATTGPPLPLPTAPKISLREILMIAVLGVIFAGLGILIRTAFNGMRTKLLLETLKFQAELNSQLHTERMAIIKGEAKSTTEAEIPRPAPALPLEMAILFSNKPGT